MEESDEPEAEEPEANDDAEGEEHDESVSAEETSPSVGEVEGIELEFEDEDGLPVQEGPPQDQREISKTSNNELPDRLEEEEIELGMVYVVWDLKVFFRRAEHLENETVALYDSLDENEAELRQIQLAKLAELSTLLVSTAKIRLDEWGQEEKRLKGQLFKLSGLLSSAEKVQAKASASSQTALAQVHQSTWSAIHELNLELLRLRDQVNNLLSVYVSSLDEVQHLLGEGPTSGRVDSSRTQPPE